MIRYIKTDGKKIEFKLHAPRAKSVSVAGSFNSWDATKTPLRSGNDGDWRTTLTLAPGPHEYRFVVDGQWITDPDEEKTAPNPYGGRNSVRIV
ncbi:MAG TPA: glycogen-binding domain-containing protein [Verrucomicrobiae bacterium]|nr:glycogen-binding domain-containing protein [Verrucomicrobiae bacterium]